MSIKNISIVLLCGVCVFVGGVTFGYYAKSASKSNAFLTQKVVAAQQVAVESPQATSVLEHTTISISTLHKACGDTITEQVGANGQYVGYTKEKLQKIYPNYDFEIFSDDEVVLATAVDGFCDYHYIIKGYNGKLGVFHKNDQTRLKQVIDIQIDKLPKADKDRFEHGLEINSNAEWMQFLEDYTS